MELIGPQYTNLAGPPSLESCTRDIYHPDMRFGLRSVVDIAHGIAAAANHLHQRGVMHGDLYAHNILHDGDGHALLGDFGAASFHAADDTATAIALQRLEVRAYGCLLEELLERCNEADKHAAGVATLIALRDRCLNEEIDSRPLFDEIAARLLALKDGR
jgi:serine/threonine protein kinase